MVDEGGLTWVLEDGITHEATLEERLVHALQAAAGPTGDPALVSELLERGADLQAAQALLCAANFGRTEIAKCLIEAGADVNERGARGNTPLINAAAQGDAEMVELLLSAGADPDLQDCDGETALDAAREQQSHSLGRPFAPVILRLKAATRHQTELSGTSNQCRD
jgi:ankyrin repeat protein